MLESKYISPSRIFVITILSIFISEILAMSIVYFLRDLPYWIVSVIDGVITVTVVFPLIYYFSFRILIIYIAEHRRAEERLERQNLELQELSRSEQKQRQLAETLSQVSLALTQTLDIDVIMNSLLEYIHRLVPYDCAAIFLLEDESRLAVRAIQCDTPQDTCTPALNTVFETWDYPYVRQVISSLKSLLVEDTQASPDWTPGLYCENIRNWFGIPMVVGGKAIGIMAVAKTMPMFFNNGHILLSEAIAAQVSVAVQNAWLFEQVRAGHERLQSLSHRLVEKQENERRYISRELHDETSQALTSIMFGLRLLDQDLDHSTNIKPQITELMQVTDRVLENLHHLAVNLRPVSLDHLGLIPALEQLIKNVSERYSLNIRFKSIGFYEGERLPEQIETSFYRIIQEALTNAVRHANATLIDVILERQDNRLIVIIEDNGDGFDTDMIQRSGHLGLLGMEERAQMMLGELHVESKTGEGTTIVVEIPYVNEYINRG